MIYRRLNQLEVSMANDYQQSSVRSVSEDNPRIYPGEESRKRRRYNPVRVFPLHTGKLLRSKACLLTRFPPDKSGGYPQETPHGVLLQHYFKLQPRKGYALEHESVANKELGDLYSAELHLKDVIKSDYNQL
jgi:hypothetical protein